MYRVRKSWKDVKSQIGAFENLNYAKDMARKNKGYTVYDGNGKAVYPVPTTTASNTSKDTKTTTTTNKTTTSTTATTNKTSTATKVDAVTSATAINYLLKSEKAANQVYKAVIDNKCIHKGGAKRFADIANKHIITCSASMSITLQKAGCLPEGKIVSHTKASGLNGKKLAQHKNTIDKCMNGHIHLKNCKVVRVDKLFKDLPAAYKKAGVGYVYDSNCAVSAGNGKIHTCNNGSGQTNSKGQYISNLRSGGYCFNNNILYCIVPNSI